MPVVTLADPGKDKDPKAAQDARLAAPGWARQPDAAARKADRQDRIDTAMAAGGH